MSLTSKDEHNRLLNSNLFQPIQLNENVNLLHHLVMAPVSMNKSHNFVPDATFGVKYFGERSKYPGTLIITEAMYIGEQYTGLIRDAPGIFTEEHVEACKVIFKAIHDNKSFVFAQLWAPGRLADPEVLSEMNLEYFGASRIYENKTIKDRAEKIGNVLNEMDDKQIKLFKDQFLKLCKDLFRAGADGIEIHACCGSLLDQFLNSITNNRKDDYGGSIANRSRLILELIDFITDEIDSSKIAIRLSPFEKAFSTENEKQKGAIAPDTVSQHAFLIEKLEARAQAGKRLAYIHVLEPPIEDESLSTDFVMSIWRGVLIRCGGYINNLSKLILDVNKGKTLIAVGSYFVSNPDLVYKLKNNQKLAKPEVDHYIYSTNPDFENYTRVDGL